MGDGATVRFEQFPSGAVYGYVLPNVQRMLLSGFFPQSIMPLVRQWVSNKLDLDKEQSDEEIEQWEQFKAHLVAWMVRYRGGRLQVRKEGDITLRDVATGLPEYDVEELGEKVALAGEEVADPERFPADDLSALFARAIRVVPSPKAQKVPT